MKILIVEDDFTIQTQLKNLLSGNGYEAETEDLKSVHRYFSYFLY